MTSGEVDRHAQTTRYLPQGAETGMKNTTCHTLYGFTADAEYILTDTDTGVGTLVQDFTFAFWGAGGTTRPHVVR